MSGTQETSVPNPTRISIEVLSSWVTGVFEAYGMPEHDSRLAADTIVRCNARGYDTHGVTRVLSYVEKLENGEINPRPNITHQQRDNILFVDGNDGMGQVVGSKAMDKAIEIARDSAFIPCFIRNGGHLGAIGIFSLRAAESGFVSILVQATSPIMALPGSTSRAIGNNPISFATPITGSKPLAFDMATCVTSRGRVLMANRAGEPIPEGWAIGPDGRATTNAEQALLGSMLPMGGAKGIGLAMMVECLAGSLTGTFSPSMHGAEAATGSASMHVGAFFFLVNPDFVIGREVFDRHLISWTEQYLKATGPEGRLPGQRAAEIEEERKKQGIPIPEEIIRELREVGDKVGKPFI